MTSLRNDMISVALAVAFVMAVIAIWIGQSSIERKVWNRCHPSYHLTLWETMWSTTRIDNCEIPKAEALK